jgi:tetratricopeptide (TPR) repeat protein
MVKRITKKIYEAIKGNYISVCALVIIFVSLYRDLEFLALISLLLFWVRNDHKMGLRLREIFVKIGKGGVEFRPPPKETSPEESLPPVTEKILESNDYRLLREANSLLSQNRFEDAEESYTKIIKEGSDGRAITNSFINLGVVYMGLWHKYHDQVYIDKSIESSRKALERDSEGYRPRINLGVALSKSRETEQEALEYFEQADMRGDMRDPLTWGKVKYFKASIISSLSDRQEGKEFSAKLQQAEIDILEALRLFETIRNYPEAAWLISEANFLLEIVKKKLNKLQKLRP